MKISLFVVFIISLLFSCNSSNNPNGSGDTTDSTKVTGDVTIYTTTADRSYDFKKSSVDFSTKSNMSPTTITLNPEQRYQTMDGFGAAITGSTSYNLLKMTQSNRTAFLTNVFSPTDGMGYSYVRVSIGCSDFSLSEYTCWDNQAAGFALTSEETSYVIPVLKEILALNPALKIIASPWTCPIWMKNQDNDGNPWNGGTLKSEYYSQYADYFVKWIQAFKQNGINIYAVTPENEPENPGNSASLVMNWNEEQNFVNNFLVPAMKTVDLNTKIYIWDHNYDNTSYATNILNGGVDNLVAGSAWHDYAGSNSVLNSIHDAFPQKDIIFTETSIGTWNDGRNLQARLLPDMENIALGTINRWCKAVIVWNLMLDSDGGPNRGAEGGCGTCFGAVDISKANYSVITKNSHYYIIGHLASVVKPDAVRIGTSGYSTAGLTYSAFENTDGTYALVLVNNTGTVQNITVSDANHHFLYEIPANAVVSYRWKK